MKKVLITGANGFVGRNLIKALKKDYIIYGIDRTKNVQLDDQHSFLSDIGDFSKVSMIFNEIKPDVLIHLAAIVHKNNNDVSEKNYNFINYECAKNLFDLCKEHNTKIIFASTIEVYGESDHAIIDENTVCNPMSYYAKSKYRAEQYLMKECNNFCILRFSALYGKEFTLNADKRIFLKKDTLGYYFKDGSYSFSFCSIENVKEFVSYLCANDLNNEIYILSDEKNITVEEMLNLHKKYDGLKHVIHLPYGICNFVIGVIELFNKVIKRDMYFSRRNFNKLFRSTHYDSRKARKLSKMEWTMERTCYGK